MKHILFLLFLLLGLQSIAVNNEEPLEIGCTFSSLTRGSSISSSSTVELSPGLVTGKIEKAGNTFSIYHDAGVNLFAWARKEIEKQKINDGILSIVERTEESPGVISLFSAKIKNGIITEEETLSWFTKYKTSPHSVGNVHLPNK